MSQGYREKEGTNLDAENPHGQTDAKVVSRCPLDGQDDVRYKHKERGKHGGHIDPVSNFSSCLEACDVLAL